MLHEPHLLRLGQVNCQLVLISRWMVSLILPTTSVLPTAGQGIIQAPVRELGKMPRLSGSPSHLKESEDLAKLGEARGEKKKGQCLLFLPYLGGGVTQKGGRYGLVVVLTVVSRGLL